MNMRRRLTAGIIAALSASSIGFVSIHAGAAATTGAAATPVRPALVACGGPNARRGCGGTSGGGQHGRNTDGSGADGSGTGSTYDGSGDGTKNGWDPQDGGAGGGCNGGNRCIV
jgi:hypothetical protein